MKTVHIKIGEHVLRAQSNDNTILEHINRDYMNFIQPINKARPDILLTIQQGSGVPTTDFQVDITTTAESIIYKRSDYTLEVTLDYSCARLSVLNKLALKHAFMNLYSAFIAHQGWGLLIHSSCLEQGGQAYLFAGQSGAGKSTVAKLSSPRLVLSDEASIIKIGSDCIKVYPSPFNSELKISYVAESCRLSGIYLLIQSQDIKTEPLKKADAVMSMLDKVFFWSHDRTETMKVMKLCKQIVEKVPVYHLYFQKNNQFWEMIS